MAAIDPQFATDQLRAQVADLLNRCGGTVTDVRLTVAATASDPGAVAERFRASLKDTELRAISAISGDNEERVTVLNQIDRQVTAVISKEH
ncbi:MAG: hypothetical protein ACRDTE_23335 [Pseudonocardiaceae bacterium]